MSELRTSMARKPSAMNSALTAAKSNVVQQAKLMDSAGTAWHAVKYGNLEMITRLFPSQCNVYSKGPVGENVFHIAMLLNTPSTLAIAKYLVKLYGKTLVNTPYQERKAETDPPGQYEGETALHIAIVNHDFDMVKFLVQNGADVRARAYGSFFQPGSAVYYGEYPLSFAACTGQKDIVSYLKRHGARVNHDRDQWGNTALHMCVYHDQPDMYDHLVEYCGASEHVQNNRSQTPLLLAASLGKVEMLQHIYNKRRRVAWAYGPVTSYSLSLREIDTVQNAGEYVPSAIETSVRKGHLELLGDPLVQTLLQTKWQRFGKTWFLVQATAYLVWVVSQTFLVWLISDQRLWNSRARYAMEVIGVVLGGLFFAVELLDFAQWTIGVYRRRKLMKAASKYRPPLYPIPGERLEAVTTQKSNFLSRLMASNRQQAVAEATEQDGCEFAAGARSGGCAEALHDEEAALVASPSGGDRIGPATSAAQIAGVAMAPYNIAAKAAPIQWQEQETEWHRSGGWRGGRPVAEGMETPFGAAALQFSTVAAGGPSPGPPSPHLTGMEGDAAGIAPMQQLYQQLAQGTSSTGSGASVAASLAALQQQVAALQQMRMAVSGATAAGLTSFTSPPSASGASLQSAANGLLLGGPGVPAAYNPMHGLGSVSTGAAPMPEPIDFVSVGLGPGPVGLPGGLMGGSKPNFSVGAQGQTKVTTMLRSPDASSMHGGEPRDGPPARVSNPSMAGLNRVPSLGGSVGEGGEIRNRMRGGGGDNVGGTAMPRASTRRQVTNVTSGPGGEQEQADAAAQGAVDEEPQPDRTPAVVRHYRTLLHAYRGYLKRMVRDPIQFVHLFHNCATLVHFIIWATSFDGVNGSATHNVRLLEFDDVVVSLMALSGWGSVLYYSRGHPAVGQLMVLVEKCWWEVIKFVCIYLILNIGFTLAFYMCRNGSTKVVLGTVTWLASAAFDPMANIGYGMIQMVRFMYGEADFDAIAVSPKHRVKTAFATMYFLLYVAMVLLLLSNVMVAMVIRVCSTGWSGAEKQWRLRWAQYVLRVEARMPIQVQQRFRLGEVSYDPVLQTRVYNHVFEVVEEREKEEERDAQIKALEAVIDKVRGSGAKRDAKRA
ncbi:hypothetical protein Vretimale_5686 [Volvox reticuliferus]|uniref:Ion transport domain-containing protein n=1 Tax=Volvox reticuliferus TaxID=1737510 RepID=A0A8J4G661_9CHLO|nr:hypothetical protein Vretifemale_5780 [Volvox reticuliferus]GIM00756.1 hypothetical protein Vretimale_5686 [Volvox reticuliferus]